MKRKADKFMILVFVLALVLTSGIVAEAHDVPDMERPASVTITMNYDEDNEEVSGGTLSIYRVGEVVEDDGNYSFALTGDFTDCGIAIDHLDSADLAKSLRDYVNGQELLPMETKDIGEDGSVVFSGLQIGLYLFVQHEPAFTYLPIDPFLVTLPYMKGGQYIYDLDAEPKTELVRVPQKDPKEGENPTPDPENPPEDQNDSKLPQTGQLWWPVPLLVCTGILLVSLGVLLLRGQKENEKETGC